MNEVIANAIAESSAREAAIYLLRNVPGLPPVTQSLHILGVGVVVASSLMIDLRLLGIAVPGQQVDEMIRRLMPWTWWALLANFLTGLPLVLARPYRYFLNPVFGIKVACLVPALLLALGIHLLGKKKGPWESWGPWRLVARIGAVVSLVLWIGVIMAGRWIAYSDYIFWEG